MVAGDRFNLADQMIGLHRRAVHFDNEQCLDIQGVADLNEGLGGMDCRPIHHLHAGRDDPGGDHGGDAIGGILGCRETDQQCPCGGRLGKDAHGDLGDDPEQPLGAGHNAENIIIAGVEVLAAKPDDLAIHQHHFDAEDVVCGKPIFQAMHPAGILRDIAADRAGDLARRVWSIVEAGVFDGFADCEVGDTGLNDGTPILVVDFENAIELGHAEEDAVGQRQCAAG